MSVILCTYNMKWKYWKTFVSLGRPARPRLDHGARKGKGDDYQEVDVNGKRLSHKNTRRSLQKLLSLGYQKKRTKWPIELWTLKQEMETNDDHATKRESFSLVQNIGIHEHIFCSFVWKHGWKTMESFPIWFNLLITSFGGSFWCPLLLTISFFLSSICQGQ